MHLAQPLGLLLNPDPCQYMLMPTAIIISAVINVHEQKNANSPQGCSEKMRNALIVIGYIVQ